MIIIPLYKASTDFMLDVCNNLSECVFINVWF